MTQLFIGHKTGVGPVVKILKYDSDDALTLANDAYDRYFFNSENQNLTQFVSSFAYHTWMAPLLPTTGIYHFGGNASTAKLTVYAERSGGDSIYNLLLRLENFYPDYPFLPICEWRAESGNPPHGSYVALRNFGSYSGGGVINRAYTFTNSFAVLAKIKGFTALPSVEGQQNWNRLAHSSLSPYVAVGDYTILGGLYSVNIVGEARGLWGAGFRLSGPVSSPDLGSQQIVQVWNLPADSTPLPAYITMPNLEAVRISDDKVAVTRPGYAVGSASGPNQHILDSDSDVTQAFCVAAGSVNIPASSSVFITNQTDIPFSKTTIADMIVKRQGELQYVPAYHPVFTSPSSAFGVQYTTSSGGITIYNEAAFAVTVTYMIFNADDGQGRSSGGERVMYRGNDGSRDYIQIKRPGSSDSDIRPSDILLDTRFPTVHILQDGWLPISGFSSTIGTTEYATLGRAKRVVPISIPAGVTPFIKFTTVFPDHILQPYFCIGYADTTGGNMPQGASRQSSLCVLDEANAEARFYLNPGSWTIVNNSGFGGSSPDPLGIRYYLFGLPTP